MYRVLNLICDTWFLEGEFSSFEDAKASVFPTSHTLIECVSSFGDVESFYSFDSRIRDYVRFNK